MERTSTSAIYDTHAGQWTRGAPILLSDFTARPFVIDELGPLAGTHVLDLGCGEGYVARLVADAGASSVFGVDASSEMVRNARSSVPNDSPCSMAFEIGDAAKLEHFPRERFDRVMPKSTLVPYIIGQAPATRGIGPQGWPALLQIPLLQCAARALSSLILAFVTRVLKYLQVILSPS
jgi:SAM-dependent methyltransferase